MISKKLYGFVPQSEVLRYRAEFFRRCFDLVQVMRTEIEDIVYPAFLDSPRKHRIWFRAKLMFAPSQISDGDPDHGYFEKLYSFADTHHVNYPWFLVSVDSMLETWKNKKRKVLEFVVYDQRPPPVVIGMPFLVLLPGWLPFYESKAAARKRMKRILIAKLDRYLDKIEARAKRRDITPSPVRKDSKSTHEERLEWLVRSVVLGQEASKIVLECAEKYSKSDYVDISTISKAISDYSEIIGLDVQDH